VVVVRNIIIGSLIVL